MFVAARYHHAIDYLYLTTIGRRTGAPHEIEIWFTRHADQYYVIAEHGEDAHWVRNLRATPDVRVRVGDARFPAHARVIDAGAEPEIATTIRQLSEVKYGWGDGLVVELVPR